MITKLLVALAPVGVILILSEFLWQKKIIKGERARKFIHILAGIWIAFWPFYVPFDGIFVLSSVALVLLIYSRITKLFHAIYGVERKTYGDLFYGLALVLCAYFGRADWIFTVSILLLAIADGGAAVVGRYWGRKNEYLIFGSKNLRKSIAGTAAFFVFSLVCIFIGFLVGGEDILQQSIVISFILLPFGSTMLENTMPYGLDNLVTPLFATLLLNSLL